MMLTPGARLPKPPTNTLRGLTRRHPDQDVPRATRRQPARGPPCRSQAILDTVRLSFKAGSRVGLELERGLSTRITWHAVAATCGKPGSLSIPAMKVSGIILAVLASALAAGASAPPPVDPAGAARGVVERVFGADMVPKFRFEKAPADPETGLDAYEIDYDTENEVVVIRGNT